MIFLKAKQHSKKNGDNIFMTPITFLLSCITSLEMFTSSSDDGVSRNSSSENTHSTSVPTKKAITDISPDGTTQVLLKQLDANGDSFLETSEVDADGDGNIDCNSVTQNWYYTKLGPVENSLFDAGLVTKLRNAICRSDFTTSNEGISQDPLSNRFYSPDLNSPYYAEEVIVANSRLGGTNSVQTFQYQPAGSQFEIKDGQILIVPDEHGDELRYQFVKSAIESGRLNFFAMEMIPHTMQSTVDTFINSQENNADYKSARELLVTYFSSNWNNKFGESRIIDGAQNPYFKLLEIAHVKHVRVLCMDVSTEYYMDHSQMDPLVVGTRNLVWSEQIPTESQRGLVFGGRAHFEWNEGVRVQDFLVKKIPSERIAIVTF